MHRVLIAQLNCRTIVSTAAAVRVHADAPATTAPLEIARPANHFPCSPCYVSPRRRCLLGSHCPEVTFGVGPAVDSLEYWRSQPHRSTIRTSTAAARVVIYLVQIYYFYRALGFSVCGFTTGFGLHGCFNCCSYKCYVVKLVSYGRVES